MKIYISGPITGQDPLDTERKFARAACIINRAGHVPVDPIDMADWGLSWKTYLQIAGEIIRSGELDAIYMLSGWKRSRGAVIEWTTARAMRIPAIYQDAADRRLWGEER